MHQRVANRLLIPFLALLTCGLTACGTQDAKQATNRNEENKGTDSRKSEGVEVVKATLYLPQMNKKLKIL